MEPRRAGGKTEEEAPTRTERDDSQMTEELVLIFSLPLIFYPDRGESVALVDIPHMEAHAHSLPVWAQPATSWLAWCW